MGKPPGNGGSVCGVAGWLALRLDLDGEGVLEALHALFQVLDLALLLGQEEVFDPVQPDLDSVDVLLRGCALEALVDHRGRLVNDDVCFYQMYSSIDGQRGVSMAGGCPSIGGNGSGVVRNGHIPVVPTCHLLSTVKNLGTSALPP
jgi:hypothetical protein